MNHFSPENFSSVTGPDYAKLFTGTAPIVLTANGPVQRGGDANVPFHQDANFWYLTGIDEPEYPAHRQRQRIPNHAFSFRLSRRIQRPARYRQTAAEAGVDAVMNAKDGWKQLNSRIKKVKHAATLSASPSYIKAYGMYVNPARSALIRKMKDINPTLKLLDLRPHLARLRMIKQPVELGVYAAGDRSDG